MSVRLTLLVGIILAAGAAGSPASPVAGLNDPCPVEWNGLPFEEALGEVAGRLDLPYILDASVPEKACKTRIRLLATHLDGRQTLRWLARYVGLEAVVIDGTILIARSDRLPEAWRWREGTARAEGANWSELKGRTAAIDWVDAPLSGIVRDVPRLFSVDLVIHPELLAKEVLIHLQDPNSTLESVCGVLAKNLDAEVSFYDGVIWARPAGLTRRSAASAPADLPPIINATLNSPLNRLLAVDRSPVDWQTFGDLITRATGLTCRMEVGSDASRVNLEGRGTVEDILEGARLLGLISYQLISGGEKGSPTLLIQVRAANR